MKLGDMLYDMILYGDIHEAPWPEGSTNPEDNDEVVTRKAIAATILKIMNNSPGGSCSSNDTLVRPYLQQEVIAEGITNLGQCFQKLQKTAEAFNEADKAIRKAHQVLSAFAERKYGQDEEVVSKAFRGQSC